MAPGPDTQLEKAIDEALKSGDVQALDVFLQSDQDVSPVKCSQQFLTKLDKLVSRSIDRQDYKAASLCLAVFYKCGKNLKLPGGQGLPGIIAKGLLKKWFEKCRQLWIQRGPQWDESLLNLSEDFFDALLVVRDSCEEGTYKITESFLYPVGQLAVDPRIYILIQKEAIRKFNLILDKIPVTLKKKKKILTSQEASDIMIKLAGQILEGGDFDFQTALMEALCRMATSSQRKELADQWFSMEHVASAFVKIRDSEFETDCRKFLNLVNGMQGDTRRVYSYPCLEAYLDKHELLMPADEMLEDFWIDFNLCSHSISFYFSLADGEAQWETICITENEVKSYTITEEGKRCILQLTLLEVVIVGAVEGSSLTIHFSSSLDILHATRSVYGHSKNIGFVGKTGTSVVKTTVKITMEETCSQVVPETQVSVVEKEKKTANDLLRAPSASVQMTPAKMKVSESESVFSCSTGGSKRGAGSLSAVQSSKGKGKPALEMVRSGGSLVEFNQVELSVTAKTWNHGTKEAAMIEQGDVSRQNTASKQSKKEKVDKHKENIPGANTVNVLPAGQKKEQSMECTYVPDTQPSSGRNTCSSRSRFSISEVLVMPPQKMNSLPRPEACLSLSQQQEGQSSERRSSVSFHRPVNQKQLHSEVTQRLKQLISERNQNPAPQDQVKPQRKTPESRKDSKDSTDLWTPKEQTNGLTNRKRKGQMSLNVDVSLIKASAKVSPTKPLKKRIPLSVKAETKRAPSSKEKREAELAGNVVKFISSRYDSTPKDTAENVPKSRNTPVVNRPIFNMTWLSAVKRDGAGAGGVMRFHNKTVTSSSRQEADVFTFNPVSPLSTGGKDRVFNNTSGTLSSDIQESSALLNTTKKGKPVAKEKGSKPPKSYKIKKCFTLKTHTEKRHVKKHLFSDTDTDYAMTEVSWLMESSRRSKPKVAKYSRQVPNNPKALSTNASYESVDLTRSSEEPVKYNMQPNRRKPTVKESVRPPKRAVKTAAAPNRPHAASRRPQRTANAYAKSYKEKDTDNSQSESDAPSVSKSSSSNYVENADTTHDAAQATKRKTGTKTTNENYPKMENNNYSGLSKVVLEQPPSSKNCFIGQQRKHENAVSEVPQVKKRTRTSSEQSTDAYRKMNSKNQSLLKKPSGLKQQGPENVVTATSKLKKRRVTPTQEQKNALTAPFGASHTSCPSTPHIEHMRSAERPNSNCSPLTPRGALLPTSPNPSCQDTPSPILLLPKPCSTVGSKGKVKASPFYSAERKSRSQFIQSAPTLPSLTPVGNTPVRPNAAEITPIHQRHPSSPLSPLPSLPLLTSTLELSKPSMSSPPHSTFPGDSVTHGSHFGFDIVCPVSQVSLSQSTTQSSVHICTFNDSPTAAPGIATEKSPSSNQDLKLVSGPSRKRRIAASSNCEENNKEEKKKSKMRGQRSPRMKPRKLFKSFAGEVSAKSEVSQMMSSCYWEAEEGNGDMDIDEDSELPNVDVDPSTLCRQFSSELKERFENRYKMTEIYNKQSLKTVQHYASSLNIQAASHRARRQEQLQEVLLEEITKLEQKESLLKSMEKDLILYSEKQSVVFCSYKEQENRRNESLTKAFQSNVCHSMEYEERLFTSQMCLIRKDMKSVQDRLLSQMQMEEIQSVKRGLHALFFP